MTHWLDTLAGRTLRSSGFRLALYFGVLVTLTMIVTIAVIYIRTSGMLYQRMEKQVATYSHNLLRHYADEGLQGLATDIDRQLRDGSNDELEILLLVDRDGHKLAGNLDDPPHSLHDRSRQVMSRQGEPIMGYITGHRLEDGSVLYVGSDLRDQESVESLVWSAIGVASEVALVVMIGGLFVFRQQMDASIGPLRSTLLQVEQGNLQARVDAIPSKDEFELLGSDINRMLDRIEVLMSGVQHVSNTIAHNLRTPLTRIVLRLRELAQAPTTGDEQREVVQRSVAEIEELIVVFEKLLRIAEAEAGANRGGFEAVDLGDVVREVVEFYEVVAHERGVQLHAPTAAGHEPWRTLGDAHLLAQALSNLLDNALKYGGERVDVWVEPADGGWVSVLVRDRGAGVPAEQRARLGERFYRLEPSVQGHGLGLSAVAAIVAMHGGRLQFDDAQPGLLARLSLPSLRG